MDSLPEEALIRAEAMAFRSLVGHLQAHPEVQNMSTMAAAGFCRNCLSKWLLAALRDQGPLPITAPITYDDVSQRIYGMAAKSWKEKYQLKATDEDTTKYNASKSYHAVHGPSALDAIDAVAVPAQANPCCRESTEPLLPLALPSLPVCLPADDTALSVGILTVSDRASAGAYQDESGPMIAKCLRDFEAKNPSVGVLLVHQKIVPDDLAGIAAVLQDWSSQGPGGINLIITTGGTGFSPRDLTPEATTQVADRLLPSLALSICSATCKDEPLAVLSRGVIGIARLTVIWNVPGAPHAVSQHLFAGLPLITHAVLAAQGH